jgi:hypothetical protein
MTNPATGNKVEELFIYAVVLTQHPEAGMLFFSPTAISMSACKAWNNKMFSQYLPSVDPRKRLLAPIYGFSWVLSLTSVLKPGVKGSADDPTNRNVKLGLTTRAELVAFDLFTSYVQPQLAAGTNLIAIAAPEADGDAPAE